MTSETPAVNRLIEERAVFFGDDFQREPVSKADVTAKALAEAIIRRRCVAGELLPSESELSRRYEVSRAVVRESIRITTEIGGIERRSEAQRWHGAVLEAIEAQDAHAAIEAMRNHMEQSEDDLARALQLMSAPNSTA
ncbi:MAG: GntR family transcriptional regulator [Chloroflexi bacterium]|nr:GntR family transcriptional regulator [Chloroflexota bacterium]